MTLCIAGAFQRSANRHGTVLCTDGRLDAGEWGANDNIAKTHLIGHNLVALMAGEWNTVRRLCSALQRFNETKHYPSSHDEIYTRVREVLNKFVNSPAGFKRAEILVSGFVEFTPAFVRARLEDDGKIEAEETVDLDSIGEGAFAAQLILKHREYNPLLIGVARPAYLIYEAKRFSERVSSVGKQTRMFIHSPLSHPGFQFGPNGPAAKNHNLRVIPESTLREFERIRERCFIQPVPEIEIPETTIFGGLLGQEVDQV